MGIKLKRKKSVLAEPTDCYCEVLKVLRLLKLLRGVLKVLRDRPTENHHSSAMEKPLYQAGLYIGV